ncbi:MAG: ThiF family adenylyltransferase [Armatimonadetes bacterium]|nr:ThiF family adenylyltransferase [Armatimonadota bacterium]GBC90720.1 tRNA threonylcarbamoyladenosine dehydratase [bacterium HR14]
MDAIRLVIPHSALWEVFRLFQRLPQAQVFGTVGWSRRPDGTDWLLRRVQPFQPQRQSGSGVLFTEQPAPQVAHPSPLVVVSLPREGRPHACLLHPNGLREPVVMRFLMPGLPEVSAAGGDWSPDTDSAERWSRTAGALGEYGWRRLRQLHYVLVGCGRNGSLIAHTLVRNGATRLTLIDPDTVELHNLDGDGFLPDHLGQPKAHALADSLRTINPLTRLRALACSVSALDALTALKEADVILCAVDHDGARWACAIAAAFYLKPLLDVGTGVLHGEGDEPLLGADLRWIVPGERCLLCMGGVAQEEQVATMRAGMLTERAARLQREWRRERRGSLRTLNQTAVGLALRMLEDYLSARLHTSCWLRLTYEGAIPHLRVVNPARPLSLCLCPHAGGGDEALMNLLRLQRPNLTLEAPAP